MKQTAVEWLVEEANLLENNGWIITLINQAKEIEKQQIIATYLKGYNRAFNSETYDAEQYYNETFKK